MKRFIAAFLLGALLLGAGQVALTMGVHPGQTASVRVLAAAILGLVMGTAILAMGMTGMAEAYERVATQVAQLLGTKTIDGDADLAVDRATGLEPHNRGFWRAYGLLGGAVCAFMAGVLSLGLLLADYSYLFSMVAMSAGLGALTPLSSWLVARSLTRVHRIHGGVASSAQLLAQMPDLSQTPHARPSGSRWQPRLAPTPRYTRSLSTRERTRAKVTR